MIKIKRLVKVAVTAAICVGLVALGTPANADPYAVGPPNAGYMPLSRTVSSCNHSSVNATYQPVVSASLNYMDTNTSYNRAGCTSGSNSTVTWYVTTSIGSTTRGSYQCQATSSTPGFCQFGYIRLNPNLLTDATNRRKTACHELGHALGLSHHSSGGYGCMISGAVSTTTSLWVSHHLFHLEQRRRTTV